MGKLGAFVDLLRYGAEVADPERWKRGQIDVNKIVALLAAVVVLLRAAGVTLPIDDAGVIAIAGGLFALVNMVFTAVSSRRAGLLPPKPVPPDSGSDAVRAGPEQGAEPSAVDRHAMDYPPDRGGGG